MKLNKHGWGLKEMLIMIGILFIFLIFAAYYIFVLYNRLDLNNSEQYAQLEMKLQTAAVNYHSDYPNDSKITVVDLKNNGYLTTFADANGNSCDGYVLINGKDYNSYIKCEYYTTKGY